MQRVLKQDDNFKIRQLIAIGPSDYQIMFMLYQPIIGVNATNLYLTLLQEKQLTARVNLDFSHARLMQLLNLDQHELLAAFLALENSHLIRTYYFSLKSTYIYDLQAPLTAKNFFADEVLSQSLKTKLNFLNFERQKYYFLTAEPNISEDYDDITNLGEPKYNHVNHIAQELMRHIYNQPVAQPETIETKSTFFYENSTPTYRTHANLSTNQSTYISKKPQQDFQKTLSFMESANADEYLTKLIDKPVDERLKNTLKLLRDKYHLSEAVINCLLEYVAFKNQKRIEPNYVLKIAQTFQECKINDIQSAMQHLKRAYSKSKSKNFTNDYQQDVLWGNNFDEFYTENRINTKQDTDEPTLSAAEIQKILHDFDNH